MAAREWPRMRPDSTVPNPDFGAPVAMRVAHDVPIRSRSRSRSYYQASA